MNCWQVLCLILGLSLGSIAKAEEPTSATSVDELASPTTRDKLVVSTLLKLSNVNLDENPKARQSVLRVMFADRGTERFVELADKFSLPETADELLRLASDEAETTLGAEAARVAFRIAPADKIASAINGPDPTAAKLLLSLAHAGGAHSEETILPVVFQEGRSVQVRSAALAVLGKTKPGAEKLLKSVQEGKLPAELHFAAANVLLTFPDEEIRTLAGKYLKLPATADAKPLPTLPELVARNGNPETGFQIFHKTGTCAKCHKVRGEGKEVGPDLSEIGSKLSKEALYVAILDPSAGISHNYETHTLLLEDGTVVSGILVSATDEMVEVKTAEAIVRKVPREEISQMKKQPTSLMPADLQKNLTADNLVDLVEFLTTLKKPGN